jgi:hypothetical protein
VELIPQFQGTKTDSENKSHIEQSVWLFVSGTPDCGSGRRTFAKAESQVTAL